MHEGFTAPGHIKKKEIKRVFSSKKKERKKNKGRNKGKQTVISFSSGGHALRVIIPYLWTIQQQYFI